MANLSAVMGAMMYGLSMVYIFKLNFKDTKLMAQQVWLLQLFIAPLLIFPIWDIVTTESMISVIYLATFCMDWLISLLYFD